MSKGYAFYLFGEYYFYLDKWGELGDRTTHSFVDISVIFMMK